MRELQGSRSRQLAALADRLAGCEAAQASSLKVLQDQVQLMKVRWGHSCSGSWQVRFGEDCGHVQERFEGSVQHLERLVAPAGTKPSQETSLGILHQMNEQLAKENASLVEEASRLRAKVQRLEAGPAVAPAPDGVDLSRDGEPEALLLGGLRAEVLALQAQKGELQAAADIALER